MILLLALGLGCLLNSRSRRCVVMTYVDVMAGTAPLNRTCMIELVLEPEHLTDTRRCVSVLARFVPHQLHQFLHLGGGKRGMNDEHMR